MPPLKHGSSGKGQESRSLKITKMKMIKISDLAILRSNQEDDQWTCQNNHPQERQLKNHFREGTKNENHKIKFSCVRRYAIQLRQTLS
jgi:hypothetical protein